ncbi:GSCFA domain-containing protein [Flavobacterium terrigena]|uniref:GSCFA family protein n=1 Tax=Flavobacterium terrigena TaxID=402734 RepID=A0A1H6SCU2_9FLAO|nr:GSCFA domain-containing protein [Flavobacterium terrigena]SEI61830.1 GSCFA family protein [Flavobacterium terrigena]
MKFQTQIPIQKADFPMDYQSKIMLLGSCFAENMAEKFEYFKFQTTVNPFGIIFNSVSLEKLILRSIHKKYFSGKDIFFHNEAWHCYEVHSELSNSNKEEFLEALNQLVDSTNEELKNSTHIITTLGTSWVYRHIESNEIVANCHKVPQKQFVKEILSIAQIETSLENIISEIHVVNPNCNFIFTVSPVRHIKDGFVENNVSKAHLISALYSSNFQFPVSNYFPSYEIMMDELRDYRFYAEDMLHPNQTAIDYIWIKFFENYVDEKEFETMQQVCDIQKALHHRPFNPNSESHLKFLANLNQKMNILVKKQPHIQF